MEQGIPHHTDPAETWGSWTPGGVDTRALPRPYVIGLGANLGDRLETLELATQRLATFGDVLARSTVYENPAVGGPANQPDFLNGAVLLRTRLGPNQLMQGLLAIERTFGRVRRVRWGPRTLDLDLLWSPGLLMVSPELEVPHPRLKGRSFALLPLLDVAPEAEDPHSERCYADLLSVLDCSTVRPLKLSGWPGRAAGEGALNTCSRREASHG